MFDLSWLRKVSEQDANEYHNAKQLSSEMATGRAGEPTGTRGFNGPSAFSSSSSPFLMLLLFLQLINYEPYNSQ